MPTGIGTLDTTFNRLLYRCAIRKDNKSCNVLDLYIAVTRFHLRLEEELKEFKIKIPIGPDPIPEDTLRDMLGDIDPDGGLARFFPVTATENLAGRVDVATKFHGALKKITGELEANINELKARQKG